jgi:hypothetical protein
MGAWGLNLPPLCPVVSMGFSQSRGTGLRISCFFRRLSAWTEVQAPESPMHLQAQVSSQAISVPPSHQVTLGF